MNKLSLGFAVFWGVLGIVYVLGDDPGAGIACFVLSHMYGDKI